MILATAFRPILIYQEAKRLKELVSDSSMVNPPISIRQSYEKINLNYQIHLIVDLNDLECCA